MTITYGQIDELIGQVGREVGSELLIDKIVNVLEDFKVERLMTKALFLDACSLAIILEHVDDVDERDRTKLLSMHSELIGEINDWYK